MQVLVLLLLLSSRKETQTVENKLALLCELVLAMLNSPGTCWTLSEDFCGYESIIHYSPPKNGGHAYQPWRRFVELPGVGVTSHGYCESCGFWEPDPGAVVFTVGLSTLPELLACAQDLVAFVAGTHLDSESL